MKARDLQYSTTFSEMSIQTINIGAKFWTAAMSRRPGTECLRYQQSDSFSDKRC